MAQTPRQKANELALELMVQELMKLRGATLSDKERDFVIKAFQTTELEDDPFDDDEFSHMTSDQLEQVLNEEAKQETSEQDPVDEA